MFSKSNINGGDLNLLMQKVIIKDLPAVLHFRIISNGIGDGHHLRIYLQGQNDWHHGPTKLVNLKSLIGRRLI